MLDCRIVIYDPAQQVAAPPSSAFTPHCRGPASRHSVFHQVKPFRRGHGPEQLALAFVWRGIDGLHFGQGLFELPAVLLSIPFDEQVGRADFFNHQFEVGNA